MRLYIKTLTEDLLEIEWDSVTGLNGICEAIHYADPSLHVMRIKPFLLTDDTAWDSLHDEDMIGLYLTEERYVKVEKWQSLPEHYLIHVSSVPDFTYPHTLTLFVRLADHASGWIDMSAPRVWHWNMTELIHASHVIPENEKEYVASLVSDVFRQYRDTLRGISLPQ